jgi:hypothetical protein
MAATTRATRTATRADDPALRFVEDFALLLTETGVPRMPARVFACVLADDSGGLTAAELAERLQDDMPSAALALLPGCGHLPPEEAAGTVASLVAEWLRARYLGERHEHAPSGPIAISIGRRPPPEHEFTGESFDDD